MNFDPIIRLRFTVGSTSCAAEPYKLWKRLISVPGRGSTVAHYQF
jgi:hypothetical protein